MPVDGRASPRQDSSRLSGRGGADSARKNFREDRKGRLSGAAKEIVNPIEKKGSQSGLLDFNAGASSG